MESYHPVTTKLFVSPDHGVNIRQITYKCLLFRQLKRALILTGEDQQHSYVDYDITKKMHYFPQFLQSSDFIKYTKWEFFQTSYQSLIMVRRKDWKHIYKRSIIKHAFSKKVGYLHFTPLYNSNPSFSIQSASSKFWLENDHKPHANRWLLQSCALLVQPNNHKPTCECVLLFWKTMWLVNIVRNWSALDWWTPLETCHRDKKKMAKTVKTFWRINFCLGFISLYY